VCAPCKKLLSIVELYGVSLCVDCLCTRMRVCVRVFVCVLCLCFCVLFVCVVCVCCLCVLCVCVRVHSAVRIATPVE